MVDLHSRIELAGNLLIGQQINRRVIEELQTSISPPDNLRYGALRPIIVTRFTDTTPESFLRPYHSSDEPVLFLNRILCRLSEYHPNRFKRTL